VKGPLLFTPLTSLPQLLFTHSSFQFCPSSKRSNEFFPPLAPSLFICVDPFSFLSPMIAVSRVFLFCPSETFFEPPWLFCRSLPPSVFSLVIRCSSFAPEYCSPHSSPHVSLLLVIRPNRLVFTPPFGVHRLRFVTISPRLFPFDAVLSVSLRHSPPFFLSVYGPLFFQNPFSRFRPLVVFSRVFFPPKPFLDQKYKRFPTRLLTVFSSSSCFFGVRTRGDFFFLYRVRFSSYSSYTLPPSRACGLKLSLKSFGLLP